MNSFERLFPGIAADPSAQGWLTSILQLGGWFGAITSGISCEIFSRKRTIFLGAMWIILGSYLTAGARTPGYLYAGRFFTGIGVGGLSATGYVGFLRICWLCRFDADEWSDQSTLQC